MTAKSGSFSRGEPWNDLAQFDTLWYANAYLISKIRNFIVSGFQLLHLNKHSQMRSPKYDLLKSGLESVFRNQSYTKTWLPDKVLFDAVMHQLNSANKKESIQICKGTFNMMVGNRYKDSDRFDGSNTSGVYRCTFKTRKFYYLNKGDKPPKYPSGPKGWIDNWVKDVDKKARKFQTNRDRQNSTEEDIQDKETGQTSPRDLRAKKRQETLQKQQQKKKQKLSPDPRNGENIDNVESLAVRTVLAGSPVRLSIRHGGSEIDGLDHLERLLSFNR